MSLAEYARNELKDMLNSPSEMDREMASHLVNMVEVFAKEGHSGFSAAYAIGILEKLLQFRPLSPLTGKDDEWFEAMEGIWQNKRCFSVFKDSKDGDAYDIDGRVFRDPDGLCYTNYDSRMPVKFPYTPTTVIVDRDAEGNWK